LFEAVAGVILCADGWLLAFTETSHNKSVMLYLLVRCADRLITLTHMFASVLVSHGFHMNCFTDQFCLFYMFINKQRMCR